MKIRKLLLIVMLLSISLIAQDSLQTFLSLERTGVAQFIKDNPEFDGRGTIIIILDTGVDMGIDGLLKTTTGETKVIDVQDFTKQGDIKFYEADIDEEDGKNIYYNEDQNLKVISTSQLELKADEEKIYIGAIKSSQCKQNRQIIIMIYNHLSKLTLLRYGSCKSFNRNSVM